MNKYEAFYKSPIGVIKVIADEEYIYELDFIEDVYYASILEKYALEKDIINNGQFLYKEDIPSSLLQCINQLDEYFQGSRKIFNLNLNIEGTVFQKSVYTALCNIPYGETASYKDIAQTVGSAKAVRAVGNTNNKNKIAIIIPCHRVIGSNGKLVGYAGGVWRKQWLLEHEKKFM